MNRNVPSNEQLAAAAPLVRECRAFWTNSIDYHGHQCRTLIMLGSLTQYLAFAPEDAPIHQVTEVRAQDGTRIL